MNKKYNLRRSFNAYYSLPEKSVRGKIAFKTSEVHWVNTYDPVVALVSINSQFHAPIEGDLKMNAFITTIKENVRGKITVLLTDRAHLRGESLKHSHDMGAAFEECLCLAQGLQRRYQSYFEDCSVVFWHAYICQDNVFPTAMESVKALFCSNMAFRSAVIEDAVKSAERSICGDISQEVKVHAAIEDILEQSASILVLSQKGYRFQFYPGPPNAAQRHVNELSLAEEKVAWINVFLSIEKKWYS